MDTDLTGAFLTTRGFLRHLADSPREEASIVFVASTAALFGEENHTDYSAAKAAMAYGMTRSLKNEIVRLAPRGRVNCVCPGWVMTPMAAAVDGRPLGGEPRDRDDGPPEDRDSGGRGARPSSSCPPHGSRVT